MVALLLYLFWPLAELFPYCYSRLVYDSSGTLLQATLAADEQLRFPPSITILPKRYKTALLTWEDRRFFNHIGVDPVAIIAAFVSNIQNRKRNIIRGGSTITMQLARMSRPHKRTYLRKAVECLRAVRISLHMSKEKQLQLYAAHVPMGGNIVGLETAVYRYFGTSSTQLTWAQAALFAVLPNAPSSINLNKQRKALKTKRDRLLALLMQRGEFDSLELSAACAEELPLGKSQIPFEAPHFCRYVLSKTNQQIIRTTLDLKKQYRVRTIVESKHRILKQQGIENCAVLIIETESRKVRAYCGSQAFFDSTSAGQVDGIQAYRSPGSLLKPILVVSALDRGLCTMNSMLHDVPTYYGNFSPMNASQTCSGITTVDQMLIQSLNIPAVRLLNLYGVSEFYNVLKKKVRLSNLFRTSEEYGLTLILGGLEANLWELCRTFCALRNGGNAREPVFDSLASYGNETWRICSKGAAWLVLKTLDNLKRPGIEYYYHLFGEHVPVSWKTGTSYGQKDAWAIGCNNQWTIGVWTGNFNGEGNALLGGAQSAGPLLFFLFRTFTNSAHSLDSEIPEIDLKRVEICVESGFLPGDHCPKKKTVYIPENSMIKKRCSLHKHYCLSRTSGFEVCSRCWDIEDTVWSIRKKYDPSVISLFRSIGKKYDTIPTHNPQCSVISNASSQVTIEYPTDGLVLHVPVNLSGIYEKVVLKAHGRSGVSLFWYLNDRYLGETVDIHSIAVNLTQNEYRLTVQDEDGGKASVKFSVYRREGGKESN